MMKAIVKIVSSKGTEHYPKKIELPDDGWELKLRMLLENKWAVMKSLNAKWEIEKLEDSEQLTASVVIECEDAGSQKSYSAYADNLIARLEAENATLPKSGSVPVAQVLTGNKQALKYIKSALIGKLSTIWMLHESRGMSWNEFQLMIRSMIKLVGLLDDAIGNEPPLRFEPVDIKMERDSTISSVLSYLKWRH